MENDGVASCMFHKMKKKALPAATELCQIAVTYDPNEPGAVSDKEPIVDLSKGEVASDTGELYRSWVKRYGTVDSPRTKCVYGRLAKNGEIALQDMTVTCANDYAVIALSSLNNVLDIPHTDSMLLTTVGNAINKNMVVSDNVPGSAQPKTSLMGMPPYQKLEDFGTAPILAEVVEADIAIRTDKLMTVKAISAEGLVIGSVPVTYEDGWMKFSVGSIKCPSVYYLIQAR
jgi:hypothetical protein